MFESRFKSTFSNKSEVPRVILDTTPSLLTWSGAPEVTLDLNEQP